MNLPEPLTIRDLMSLLEKEKAVCEENLKLCEDTLKVLKNRKHVEYWTRERDDFKDRIKCIEKRLEIYRKINERNDQHSNHGIENYDNY
jgi:flagellar motility protein MotE (MotC chaperone)